MQFNFQHCASLVREADRDRYLATLFAPAEKRDALFALFAFNVEIGRIRDVAREPIPGEIRLQWWREVLSGERDGEAAANPVTQALTASLAQYKIAPERLTGIVDAHTFDLYDDPMATLDDLDNYAVMTQSAIIDVAAEILMAGAGVFLGEAGTGSPSGNATNQKLRADRSSIMMLIRSAGIASTVAAVLTGLARHAAHRQLYIPLEVLDRHGVARETIFAGEDTLPLKAALAELRRHARRQLAAARADMEIAQSQPAVLPALLPVALVGPTLRPMDRRGYEPFAVQPLSLLRRQWLLWRAARDPRRIFAG